MTNAKHQIPRFVGDRPLVVQRASFLGDAPEFRTFFGPGQLPSDLPDVSGRYVAPTDWMRHGALLRVPQVCWLSAAYTDVDQPTYGVSGGTNIGVAYEYIDRTGSDLVHGYVWTDGTNISLGNYPYGSDPLPPSSPPYFYVPAQDGSAFAAMSPVPGLGVSYNPTVPNTYAVQYPVTMAAFSGAKARIENLRPGRTWLTINDFSSGRDNLEDLGYRVSEAIAPDPSEQFFGTDFLHVHCGTDAPGGSPFTGRIGYLPIGPGRFSSFYDLGRAQVVGSYPKFSRYAVRIFGPGADFAVITSAPPIQVAVPIPPEIGGEHSYHVQAVFTTPEEVAVFNADQLQRRDSFNDAVRDRNSVTRATLAEVAADLKDQGFVYAGGDDQVTADFLVGLIAAHYGFNPATGKDLDLG